MTDWKGAFGLSQQCIWGLRSSEKWRNMTGWMMPDHTLFNPTNSITTHGLKLGSAAAPLLGSQGSNSAGGMDVCLLWVLCCQEDGSVSGWGVLLSVVCLSVIVKPRQWGGPGPLGAVEPFKKNVLSMTCLIITFSVQRYERCQVRWMCGITWKNELTNLPCPEQSACT